MSNDKPPMNEIEVMIVEMLRERNRRVEEMMRQAQIEARSIFLEMFERQRMN